MRLEGIQPDIESTMRRLRMPRQKGCGSGRRFFSGCETSTVRHSDILVPKNMENPLDSRKRMEYKCTNTSNTPKTHTTRCPGSAGERYECLRKEARTLDPNRLSGPKAAV